MSNLPYTATSVDLQTLFSDIAPVRTAFVVTEHGTGVSKGVGYVSFAIKEDAQSAFDKIAKEGINLVGRSLRVQWADNKVCSLRPYDRASINTLQPKERGEVTSAESNQKPPRPPHPSRPRLPLDPLAIRTIVVSGLPPSIDSKALWKKIRKYDGVEKLDWPIKASNGDEDPSTGMSSVLFSQCSSCNTCILAYVLFATPSAASVAVSKLHAHVFKGCLLSVTLKKRLDTLSKPTLTKPSEASSETPKPINAAPNPASRLIVRNLPFEATEQDLRAVFLPYGPIYSIHIPKAEQDGDGEGKKDRTKGFAFVWMLSRKDAENAIEGCNGIVVRAGTADSMVSDKQKKKKQRREEKKLKATTAGESVGDEANELIDNKRATERTIAVDWALSKDKWKEEKAKIEEVAEDVDMEDASSSEASTHSDHDSEDSDHEGGLGMHEENDGDDESSDEDMEEPVKPTLPPPETGTTLFIRNVPFQATEDELRTL